MNSLGRAMKKPTENTTKNSPLKNLDVVYFCRDGENEELRYSLRSVEKNFPYHKVWIFGEKPNDIEPDEFVYISQERVGNNTKWDRVREMMRKVCLNSNVTDDFVLFNDDFYVMAPVDELPPMYRCSLYEYIVRIEIKNNNQPSRYSQELRRATVALDKLGLPCQSYELHLPMILNKHKLLEVLGAFPDLHCTRSLYGNYHHLEAVQHDDVKIYGQGQEIDRESAFLSSLDDVFEAEGGLMEYLAEVFPDKSKFEREVE